MKSILMFTVFVIVAAPYRLIAQGTNGVFALVTVIDRQGKGVIVNNLEESARKYLWEKAPETKTNKNLEVSVQVDCSKKKSSFTFTFFGEMVGEREYIVSCDSKGQIIDFQTRLGDSVPLGDLPLGSILGGASRK